MDRDVVHVLFVLSDPRLKNGPILFRNLLQALICGLLLFRRAALIKLLKQTGKRNSGVGADKDIRFDVASGFVRFLRADDNGRDAVWDL
jgi:hypothetical protein